MRVQSADTQVDDTSSGRLTGRVVTWHMSSPDIVLRGTARLAGPNRVYYDSGALRSGALSDSRISPSHILERASAVSGVKRLF